jgi:ribonuclease BN (tRNA processing enzyme)
MRLTVLGSSGAWPEAGRACSGFLLESNGASLLLDLGSGTLPRLLGLVRPEQLTGVLFTHAHADHCVDLYGLYRALRYPEPPLAPPPIFGLPEVLTRVGALDGPGGADRLRQELGFRDLTAGQRLEAGPFRIRTFELPHFVPNLGFRVEVEGRVVAYTGDTGPSDALHDLARDADLFVCEAMRPPGVLGDRARFLLSAEEAGRFAHEAGARRLLLTHFQPGSDRPRARTEAAREFPHEVLLADEGAVHEIG